jgi:hypothetical protein
VEEENCEGLIHKNPKSEFKTANFFMDNIFPLSHKILTIEDVTPEPFSSG